MNVARTRLLVSLMPCTLLLGMSSSAGELYRWVDDDGVVNFSQWAPADSHVEATTLYIAAQNDADYDPAADDYSIQNQAKRTGAVWQEVKDRRAAAEALRRQDEEERRRREQQYAYYQPLPYYVRSVYRPWHPFRPHVKPLPHHPLKPHHRHPPDSRLVRQRGLHVQSVARHPGAADSRPGARFVAPSRRASQPSLPHRSAAPGPRQVRVLH